MPTICQHLPTTYHLLSIAVGRKDQVPPQQKANGKAAETAALRKFHHCLPT